MSLYKDYRTIPTTVSDIDAINNSIRNILSTPLGSLPGKPYFGSRLNEIAFSQMSSIDYEFAKKLIEEALSKFEDRIYVTDVNFMESSEYNSLSVVIDYVFRDKAVNVSSSTSIILK